MQRESNRRTFLSVVLALLISLSPPIRPVKAAPQESEGQGITVRADLCAELPTPPGNAFGIEKRCHALGHSSGITKGDFNGDGIADLAIGIPDKTILTETSALSSAGAVQIVYGTAASGLVASGTGVPTTQLLFAPAFPLNFAPQAHDRFGAALAAGDFNGDGFTDLAVGMPGRGPGLQGAVMVFMGSRVGLSTTPAVFFPPSTFYPIPGVTSTHGAYSLTWGDFNGDGFGDLVVASDFCNACSPTVGLVAEMTVLFGSANGLTTNGQQGIQFNPPPTPDGLLIEPRLVLSAADFNADRVSDLVAGLPVETVNGLLEAGGVHIFFGVRGFGPTTNGQQEFIAPAAAAGDHFGAALAPGDFNGDASTDLAVGAPGEQSNAGAVFIIEGTATGLRRVIQKITRDLLGFGVASSGYLFGQALAANKFNDDTFADLAIGVPGAFVGVAQAGEVDIIYGSSSFLSTTLVRSTQKFTSISGRTQGDQFGTSVTAWNFGLSTQADLAVGIPFKQVETSSQAGVVNVFYGSTTGLDVTGEQVWTENSFGSTNGAASGDHFGLALY